MRTVTTAGGDVFVTSTGGAMQESTATVSIMFTFYSPGKITLPHLLFQHIKHNGSQ